MLPADGPVRAFFDHSESIAKIGIALAKAQGKLGHARADATNPHFKSNYADLASVIDVVRPVLSECGIAWWQAPFSEGEEIGVVTMLIHEGEFLRNVLTCRPSQHTPQAVGTVISYLRRYSLAAVTGVAQVDDDGNAGSGKAPTPTPPPPAAAPAPARASRTKPKLAAEDPTPGSETPPTAGGVKDVSPPSPESTKIAPIAPGVPTADIPEGNVPIYVLKGGKWDHVGSGPPLTKAQQAHVKILQKEMNIPEDEWVSKLTVYFGKTSSTQLTEVEAVALVGRLEKRKALQLPQ